MDYRLVNSLLHRHFFGRNTQPDHKLFEATENCRLKNAVLMSVPQIRLYCIET